jgi:hypothetical protein
MFLLPIAMLNFQSWRISEHNSSQAQQLLSPAGFQKALLKIKFNKADWIKGQIEYRWAYPGHAWRAATTNVNSMNMMSYIIVGEVI